MLYIVLSSCEINQIERKKTEGRVIDSVSEWIQLAKDPKIEKGKQLQFLRLSNDQLLHSKNDSFKVKKLLRIADRYYELDQDSLFLEINDVVFDLAKYVFPYRIKFKDEDNVLLSVFGLFNTEDATSDFVNIYTDTNISMLDDVTNVLTVNGTTYNIDVTPLVFN